VLGRIDHRTVITPCPGRLSDCTHRFLAINTSLDGSIHFVCMDWRHMREVLDAGENIFTELKNLCVWTKTNAGMGSRSQH
jgi:hypothetical protein